MERPSWNLMIVLKPSKEIDFPKLGTKQFFNLKKNILKIS
jgi:hypothetical protein